jgi:predicted nuclease of predicted toxin-antitoxin system
MLQLYSDEQFPLPVVERLRNKGYDVLTVKDAGNANQGIPDDQVLIFATNHDRAVITQNRRDFIWLKFPCLSRPSNNFHRHPQPSNTIFSLFWPSAPQSDKF